MPRTIATRFGIKDFRNMAPLPGITPPRLVRFEREGMRKNYRGNIANEINMLGCITFATRYGVVVGLSF